MASTYSPNLRLELIGTGEQQGTWGITTNTNLGTLLEEAIGGYTSVTVTDGADTTLTTNNGSADQSRNMVINLTGALTAARNVICPAIEKMYVVKNATTGGFAVTFKVSGQTGVSIPNGSTYILYVNGTDAVLATGTIAAQNSNNVSITGGSITGITDLAIADGGTGASTAAGAATNLGLGTGDSPQFAAVNIGNATDTTITRVSAGVIAVEGKTVVTETGGQTVQFAAGTVSAPSITTTGDTNTGIYFPSADTIAFTEGGTEAMRIDSSGNLGIGTSSPGGRLDTSGADDTIVLFRNTTAIVRIRPYVTSYATSQIAALNAAASAYAPLAVGGSITILETNGVERMRIDSSGNVGLGVTPSAWISGWKAFDVGNSASLVWPNNNSALYLLANAYYNGTNWLYKQSAAVGLYAMVSGQHQWHIAPSGTAGNTITFTQAMTLDASGNLVVGGTAAVYGSSGRGVITINGSSQALLGFTVGGLDKGFLYHAGTDMTLSNTVAGALVFQTNNTERMRVDSSGNVLVTGSGGLGYGTGSGGTVTQATSKSTGVTLNKTNGQITMNNAALAANTTVAFTVSCSACAFTDVVNVQHRNGASYNVWTVAGIGAFDVYVRNITGGSLSEAIVINFAIIKAVTS